MVKRSLRTSPLGIEQAKRAFAQKGWTQENLAGEVGLKTRQSIWRFFTGQPIERQVFLEICLILELDWRKIAIDPPSDFPKLGGVSSTSVAEIDALVKQVRLQRRDKIQHQCGTLQLLNISHPVEIDNIYINVNTLEEIPSQQWLELADLQRFTPKEFNRFGLGDVSQTQIAGVEAVETYSKLRVLGKPGAGKTTFLQHLAIRCSQGSFAAERVPVFITLRDFVDEAKDPDELSLGTYLHDEFLTSGISDPSVVRTLLQEGRMLLLLDGLDEVLHQERKAVVKEIRRLSEKYQRNLFVVTCRTATQAATLRRFTDVEMAPFTQDQIVDFAQKWFTTLTKTTTHAGQVQAVHFIQKLDLAENMPLRRLVTTPLFLHLACWIFHYQGRFPIRRSQFYKQCLDLLLSKWDETKGVERDEMFCGCLLPQKLKLLSQVAKITFEQEDYFFGKQVIEHHISDYIQGLPNASIELEESQLESERILKAIESQHGILTEQVQGIFSFSYPIFQEYFTARKIVANHNSDATDHSLEQLVSHMNESRWREVFLMTAAMLRTADPLVQLMKQKIDAIGTEDADLQELLTWAAHKPLVASPQPAAIHTFYFALTHQPHLVPHLVLASMLSWGIFLDIVFDFSLEQQEVWQRYCDANQLLLDCLNSNCEVTVTVRQEIEAALLLPHELVGLERISTAGRNLTPDLRQPK
ncbi:MAG: NACHT domain-containing NTPase [Drouetiella hepatica Uher 2000/2452]|jgi:predicted NACHT family NTPase|uniref:NACHT domain-containing NTPase n=1 Tax=Drouetiella hepatica Uher 2000/2452 TaxID=904376 RepID=A0A951Q7Z3_9CYAN|nr:NACHT domain-containing NTPase [Drouetiella hepatica Uher 2000/2452]